MTDQPESASEYADLLGNLDPATWDESYNIHKFVAVTMRHAAAAIAAIRTLEAKVRDDEKTMRDMAARWETTIADRDRLDLECARLTLDRDRLAGEVERIRVQFDEAIFRLKDMLEDDDGQAFKEAGKFLLRIRGRDDES